MWGIFYFLGKVDRTFIFGEGWGEGGEGKEVGVEKREGGGRGREKKGVGGKRGRRGEGEVRPLLFRALHA